MAVLVCAGDLHVGAGAEYGRAVYGPNSRLDDQRAALAAIVDVAIDREADALVLAGDLWHRRRPTPAELIVVHRELHRCSRHGVPVVAIPGNHDVLAMGLPTALSLLESAAVRVFSRPGVLPAGELGLDVGLAFLPWMPTGAVVARRGGGDRDQANREAAQLLVETARGLYAELGGDAVLVAHWAVSGGKTQSGHDTRDLAEVVLPLGALAGLDFRAVVLAHIHRPQILDWAGEQRTGPIFYTSSPLPADFGEAHVEHGCYVLDTSGPRGEPAELTFVPIPSRPFVTMEYGAEAWVEIAERREDVAVDGAVVRAIVHCSQDEAQSVRVPAIRRALLEQGAHRVYSVRMDVERQERARVAGMDETMSPMDALEAWARSQWGAAFVDAALGGEDGAKLGRQWAAMRERAAGYFAEVGA